MESIRPRLIGRHRVLPSPFNELGGSSAASGSHVAIADCTLRDGEQQAGLVFDHDAKLEIAQALDNLGVFEIEAATPASSEDDREAVRDICRLGLRAKVSVVCRALARDIDEAVELGAWGARISFPIGPLQRKYKLKDITPAEYIRRSQEITKYAKERGLNVIFSPYDTTRAELPFLLELVAVLNSTATVDRLRIVDTTGCALPEGIAYLVREVRRAAPDVPLEIHCHDDFGLATANTVAGVAAGATFVSSTINGLGERSGNAATEQVALVLEGLYGITTGLDLTKLTEVSATVARLSGVPLPPNMPVTGTGSFHHEAGMVVAAVLEDPFTAESYDPAIVGQHREILVGKKSGVASLAYKARQIGLTLDPDRVASLLEEVKIQAVRKRRALTDDEFRDLAMPFVRPSNPVERK
jgi:isopropylmalate/homocitrate/citramalate synthase